MILNTSNTYTVNVGDILSHPTQGNYKILKLDGEKILIEFLDEYRFKETIYFNNIKNGYIINPYAKTLFNKACIGNVNSGYSISKEYNLWINIINKCYNKDFRLYKIYGDKGVMISRDWLCFEYFYKDVKLLPGYGFWIIDKDNKYHLSRDYYYTDRICKLYSKETCIFAPYYKYNLCKIIG